MQFESWEPIYLAILEDFGFSRQRDEEAAELLRELLQGREDSLLAAEAMLSGRRAVICGNAPCLARELENMRDEEVNDAVFLAADGATASLLEHGILPAIVVTDLDGPFPAILKANKLGSISAVHAHGDNLEALKRYVPLLENIIGTVQCRPQEGLFNFGGFTDGDRAVFLAKEMGAASIDLVGFDFDDQSVTPRKKKKLAWARKLICLALSSSGQQL
ncbi:MAG: 6-hydroxymethylpterin diphosphokinase MptE-like protein [Methanothrix sp.]